MISHVQIPKASEQLTDKTPFLISIAWYKFLELLTRRATSTDAGWTVSIGTPNKGAYATYAGHTASAGYVQAEAQATDDAVKAASQRIKALEDALTNLGIISP